MGEIVEIKTLVSHPMENGFRRDATGLLVAQNILTRFECWLDQKQIFSTQFFPAVAANPYLAFSIKASLSGELRFIWTDQHGKQTIERRAFNVISDG